MQPISHATAAPSTVQPAAAIRATQAAHCLVVAADDARRENFGFAAREGGWDVTLCCDSAAALSQAGQKLLHLAIVDLSGAANPERANFRFLVEQLACTSRMLLLVCGSLDDSREEVWARHLGVWMYLPGAIDGTELVGLCVAARETVERLMASSRHTRVAREDKKYRSS
jgi:DNA-binding response OmpR family regulator